MNLNLSTDYTVVDDLEPVTLISVTTPQNGLETGQPIAQALRRNPSFKELAASNGAYTGQDVVWDLPAALIQGAISTVKPGDLVIDQVPFNYGTVQKPGTTYTVLECSFDAVMSWWHCITRNMVIAWQLRDQINIEQSAITYDADGAAVRAWPTNALSIGGSTPYASLACRVQLDDANVQYARGVRGQGRNWLIYLSQQILIDVRECRVVWTDVNGRQGPAGTAYYFDVDHYQAAERIDELPRLIVHESPDAVAL